MNHNSILYRILAEMDDEDTEMSDFQREIRSEPPENLAVFLDTLKYDSALEMWVILYYSDLTGTAATRANAHYLLSKYSSFVTADRSDNFNATTVGIHREELGRIGTETLQFLIDDLKHIQNGHVLDGAKFREIIIDKKMEAWVTWVAGNFKYDLAEKFPDCQHQLNLLARGGGDGLWNLFVDARQLSGNDWTERKGAEQTINVEDVADAVTRAMIDTWTARTMGHHQQQEALNESREYSCVMAPAPADVADAVIRWGQMFVTDDVLYTDPQKPDSFGREKEVHVTVKFGLHKPSPCAELLKIIEETQPFEIDIGPCTLFENELFDVVKFDVGSDGLRQLNARISELPNSDEHPEYHPHMTVAYVIKGTCNELIGKPLFDPKFEPDARFLVKSVIFSSLDGTKMTLFLGKPNLKREPVREAESDDDDDAEMDIDTAKDVYGLDADDFKNFTDADVREHGALAGAGTLYADRSELIQAPTWWQKKGLCQTASGYGAKLNSGLKISFNGKLYRIYVTCYGNASSSWFIANERKIFVN